MGATISSALTTGAEARRVRVATVARVSNGERAAGLTSVTNLFVTGARDRENARGRENARDQVAPTSHVTVGTHVTYHVTSGPLGYHVTYHVTHHVIQLA